MGSGRGGMVHMVRLHPAHLLNFQILHRNLSAHPRRTDSFIPSLFCFGVLTLPHRYVGSCWWTVHPGIDQWPAGASITSFHPQCSSLPSPMRFAIIRPRTGVSSSGDLVQAMRRGAFGATESFVRWSMGGGERTTAAPPTSPSQHALVNNEGTLNYACCEAGYVESAPSIHSARRFAR